jgi:molybdenum cofactor biosynthesis protein B
MSAARRPRAAAITRRGVHRSGSAGPPAGVGILTVSDTRRGADDTSGARAEVLVHAAGHTVVARAWVADTAAAIRRRAASLLRRADLDLLFVTGGTGIAPRDVTPEALAPLVTRALPGFGERFRARSERQVGAAAWLSRAGAGVANGRLLVWCPGSTPAVSLALAELLLPELAHALRLLGRR